MSRADYLRKAGGVKRFHARPIIGENTVAHHSWGVAVLLFELMDKPSANLVKACLYHDIFEYVTGDIPYTAKVLNPEIKRISEEMEAKVAKDLEIDTMFNLTPEEEMCLKFCDMLDLMWFAVSQRQLGNMPICESFVNGARFLRGHVEEFQQYPELAGAITTRANIMLHEAHKEFNRES